MWCKQRVTVVVHDGDARDVGVADAGAVQRVLQDDVEVHVRLVLVVVDDGHRDGLLVLVLRERLANDGAGDEKDTIPTNKWVYVTLRH